MIRYLCLVLLISSSAWSQVLKLNPQLVVDLALGKSDRAKQLELQELSNQVFEARVLKKYDFGFELNTNYFMTKAESIDGFANEKDKRVSYALGISKYSKTGTNIKLMYESLGVNTDFSTYNLTRNIPSTQYKDVLSFELEQNLLNNSFGSMDRKKIEIAHSEQEILGLQSREKREDLVLDSMDLYWRAFVAKEILSESFASRDRYRELLKIVAKKKKLGYTVPGEWARTQSELEMQDQKVKLASLVYLRAADDLKRVLKIAKELELEFEPTGELSAVPPILEKDIQQLRSVREKSISVGNSQRELEVAQSASLPELNFVAKIQSTGIDTESQESVSELASFTKPTYYLGLSLRFLFGDNATGAEVRHANYQLQIRQIENQQHNDKLKDLLSDSERVVNSAYLIAVSSKNLLAYRTEAAKEIRAAYNQGRIDIQELITAYNALSSATSDRIVSMGEYHMSLNRLSALRDELVKQ